MASNGDFHRGRNLSGRTRVDFVRRGAGFNSWLPKSHARVMYWIYAEPVINHPEILASSSFPSIRCPRRCKEAYRSMTKKRDVTLLFPRDCIIDAKEGMLCNLVDGSLVPVEKTPHKFWV